MKRTTVLLVAMTSFVLLAPTMRAAVQFTAGGGVVTMGDLISIPVTVSGFSGIGGVQFDLTYDFSLLQYQSPPANFGLPELGGGNFSNPSLGIIRLSWYNPDLVTYPTGISVADGTTLFAVQFLANTSLGSSSIGFAAQEVFDFRYSVINDASYVVGSVNVVPEPINIALGVFAGLFVGATTLRWAFNKRSSQTVS